MQKNKGQRYMLNTTQTKNLIKSINKLNTGFSVKAFYTVLDDYKKNIKSEKQPANLSAAFAGEKHIYSMKSPFEIKIEAYIKKNTVNYVSIWMYNGHNCILNQANTDLAAKTFLYVEQLYNNQHR